MCWHWMWLWDLHFAKDSLVSTTKIDQNCMISYKHMPALFFSSSKDKAVLKQGKGRVSNENLNL